MISMEVTDTFVFLTITVHKSPTTDSSPPIRSGPTSYAKFVTGEPSMKSVNFRTLISPVGNGADVAIPLESIRAISERFANTTYGFFCSNDGLDAMIENGSWFIRNNPFILKKWNPDVNLQKEDVGNVLVWVKFHGLHMTAFSEDGLSIIATNLSTHLMIDSYTFDMCMQSWGTSSNAKAMSELRADEELKDTIVVDMPKLVGERKLLLLVDVDGKPLPNVVSTANADSDSEVEEVYDEHATFMASTELKRGSDSDYGTNSLWEQWMKTKRDDDYDLYDDDLYDSHDMFDNLHAICDEFDITTNDQKKKWIHFDPSGGVVRSGFSTPLRNGSETNKKVCAALTKDFRHSDMLEEGGDDVKSTWPLWLSHTHDRMAIMTGSKVVRRSESGT
ncbi:putative RNA-directed DNA polymerase, eukaryota, reverse transcriptase zinc-binding domain protein [Tanacetum coccineum]